MACIFTYIQTTYIVWQNDANVNRQACGEQTTVKLLLSEAAASCVHVCVVCVPFMLVRVRSPAYMCVLVWAVRIFTTKMLIKVLKFVEKRTHLQCI